MRVEIDLTPEQLRALEPLLSQDGSAVLASVHRHRPYVAGMQAEKIGRPVLICGAVPASVFPKLRELIRRASGTRD
jgi:hypothetical protein